MHWGSRLAAAPDHDHAGLPAPCPRFVDARLDRGLRGVRVIGLWQRFTSDIRTSFAWQTESHDVERIRLQVAWGSVLVSPLALIGLFAGISPPAAIPGWLVVIVGAGLGIAAHRTKNDTWLSRRFSLWALIATVLGLAESFLVIWLSQPAA
jgi:hypothetical protein